MASLIADPNGRRRIQFTAPDGRRRTIRLGRVSARQAQAARLLVEELSAAGLGAGLDPSTARRIEALPRTIHDRLSAAGLLRRRRAGSETLGGFLDELLATLNVKPNTLRNYAQARRHLEQFLGANRALADVTPADAAKYRAWLRDEQHLSEATIAKWIIIARQFFARAIQWELITRNPFAGIRAGAQRNRSRMYFVTREEAQRVIDACPDAQWRLMFALARFGGLRCPSEILALTWADVDFEHSRLRVPSPKTEHHEGRAERIVPMFPELRPHLLEAFEQAEPGAEHLVTRYRDSRQNLRTQLCRIIRRAGLKVWPRPWHNLRSTRQTELAERFPAHVVCAWLGNSPDIAQDHYLQVTDAHFERAAGEVDSDIQKAAQNAAHRTLFWGVTGSHRQAENPEKTLEMTVSHPVTNAQRSQQESNL
ncbi:tyrosine-type recombinase/integrase [Fontivita pretiosa]|uniref:tyrosine-type recombinase/integrase n=1 Tax=Fontivita pretiosa TaxID=2989684 RepID=UPI003D16298B